jgi:integrase
MKGAGAKDRQELLGHITLTMTMRYIHLTTAHKEKAVGLLPDAGQKQRTEMAMEWRWRSEARREIENTR